MRSLISSVALAAVLLPVGLAAETYSFHIAGEDPGAWPQILSSIGLQSGPSGPASVVVAPSGVELASAEWLGRVDRGTMLVLEGESRLASELGFRPQKQRVVVESVRDVHMPKLAIIWEKSLELAVFEVPKEARVFTRERWQGAPLVAGYRRGAGAILWLAASPGKSGGERFPYLLQALADLGMEAPLRSARLWAFFDSSYRLRADVDYLAERWRKAGIAALDVAAWHYWEPDAGRDAYLGRLIEACHRRAILVYAWLEFPHVSEKFWADHPEWREKTAIGQDAQLDWRKLMNLANPKASEAVAAGLGNLLGRFDWDGVNLAELYFESLEGVSNPARFTPMNEDVRREFAARANGFDPRDLFDPKSARFYAKNPGGLAAFLSYRAELARRLQGEWMDRVEAIRRSRAALDLVLTQVDDRIDTRMRDLIGADAARVLPLLDQHDFTFLIEDPATLWSEGPQRYPQIAARYAPLTRVPEKLAIDVNIVERYQDVYPTKQPTGTELFETVHLASSAFPRVALYFENSILPPDLPLLASAAAAVSRLERAGSKVAVESRYGVGIPWKGAALVDGRLWPVEDGSTVWLPAGVHAIEPAPEEPPTRLLAFNGELRSARLLSGGMEFSYQSSARALAVLERPPKRLEIDGVAATPEMQGLVLFLPRGQHLVSIRE